jgi:putative membrane protein
MRYISWFIKISLFLLLLGFAAKNSETVTLRYYLGYEWQAPLVLVILVFLVLGAAIGIAACLGYLFRQRRQLAALKKELQLTGRAPDSVANQ